MEALLAILIFAALVAFISVPLRRKAGADEPPPDARIADLEARKEAKYAEIRDAQLDHASGKLSDEDYRRQDAELRAEAIDILKQLDAVNAGDRRGG